MTTLFVAPAIRVRRIEEIHASVERGVKNGDRIPVVALMLGREPHASQPKRALGLAWITHAAGQGSHGVIRVGSPGGGKEQFVTVGIVDLNTVVTPPRLLAWNRALGELTAKICQAVWRQLDE